MLFNGHMNCGWPIDIAIKATVERGIIAMAFFLVFACFAVMFFADWVASSLPGHQRGTRLCSGVQGFGRE